MAEVEHNTVDYSSRGLAAEAIQALRSHEQLDNLQFRNMENQYEDIKKLILDTNVKIDQGFKAYDSKFWNLAISIILLLVSGVGGLFLELILRK